MGKNGQAQAGELKAVFRAGTCNINCPVCGRVVRGIRPRNDARERCNECGSSFTEVLDPIDVAFFKELEKRKNILKAQKDKELLPLRSNQSHRRIGIPSTA